MPINFVGQKRYRLVCFLTPEVEGQDAVSIPLSGNSFQEVLKPVPSCRYLKYSIRSGLEAQLSHNMDSRDRTIDASRWRVYWKKKGDGVLYPIHTLTDFIRFVDTLKKSSFNSIRLVAMTDNAIKKHDKKREKRQEEEKKDKEKEKLRRKKKKDRKRARKRERELLQSHESNKSGDMLPKGEDIPFKSSVEGAGKTVPPIDDKVFEKPLDTRLLTNESEFGDKQESSPILAGSDKASSNTAQDPYKEHWFLTEEDANCISEDSYGEEEDYVPKSPLYIESMLSDSDFEQI